VEQETDLKAMTHGYWERLTCFLTSEVGLDIGLDLKDLGAPAKLGFKPIWSGLGSRLRPSGFSTAVCLAAHNMEFPGWTPGNIKRFVYLRRSRGFSHLNNIVF
jgi:hypothetical protein